MEMSYQEFVTIGGGNSSELVGFLFSSSWLSRTHVFLLWE